MATIGFQPLLLANVESVFGGQSTLPSQMINAKFMCLTLPDLAFLTLEGRYIL